MQATNRYKGWREKVKIYQPTEGRNPPINIQVRFLQLLLLLLFFAWIFFYSFSFFFVSWILSFFGFVMWIGVDSISECIRSECLGLARALRASNIEPLKSMVMESFGEVWKNERLREKLSRVGLWKWWSVTVFNEWRRYVFIGVIERRILLENFIRWGWNIGDLCVIFIKGSKFLDSHLMWVSFVFVMWVKLRWLCVSMIVEFHLNLEWIWGGYVS